MSDVWEAQVQAAPAANDAMDSEASATVAAPATAGAMLRRAREAAGLHVAALAVALKVPVRKVEALEADRYDALTDAVFVRALASSICRTLKIDAQPVLERLPQMAKPRLMRRSESLNAPFRAPSDGAPPTWLDQLSRPVFFAVFALLLGALVLILLPKAQTVDSPALVQPVVATPPAPAQAAAVPSVPAAPEAATAVVTPVAAPAASAPPAPAPASPAKAAAPSALAVPVPVSVVADVAATPASGIVVFRTKGPSWIEVTDAKGVVAVSKVLEAGEAAGASGALPLRVTIGRVDSTEVQVRGKPFDLRRVSKDNVARFEVN
jgi:cytoskeleton protein RodZ